MKNVTLAVLLVTSVVLGGLYLQGSRAKIESETRAVTLQQKIDALQAAVEEREKESAALRKEAESARADVAIKQKETDQLRGTIRQMSAAPAQGLDGKGLAQKSADGKSSNPLSSFSKLFKDPAMRDAIKTQQRVALGTMFDRNYQKLFSDLRLTPEQSKTLKDLLLDKQLSAADAGMAMLSDEGGPTNRLEQTKQIKAATDAADAKIREFLGDNNYSQYQDYEKGMADRMAINGFRDQLTGSNALTLDQEQLLAETMGDLRRNFKFSTEFPGASGKNANFEGDFSSMFTEEKINQHFQEAEQLDQQYLTKAKTILNSEQYESFQKYLTSQQALQKASMQMAAKMFAAPKSE